MPDLSSETWLIDERDVCYLEFGRKCSKEYSIGVQDRDGHWLHHAATTWEKADAVLICYAPDMLRALQGYFLAADAVGADFRLDQFAAASNVMRDLLQKIEKEAER